MHAALLVLLLSDAHAVMFATYDVDVPVERLVSAAELRTQADPADADAWRLLGRIHYLAFVHRTETFVERVVGMEPRGPKQARRVDLAAFERGKYTPSSFDVSLPDGDGLDRGCADQAVRLARALRETPPSAVGGLLDPWRWRGDGPVWLVERPSWASTLGEDRSHVLCGTLEALGAVPAGEVGPTRWDHAVAARRAFERAVALEPADLGSRFALASLLLQARGSVRATAPGSVPPPFRDDDPVDVIDRYLLVALDDERAVAGQPPSDCWSCSERWREGAGVLVDVLGLGRVAQVASLDGVSPVTRALAAEARAWLESLWFWERWRVAGLLHRAAAPREGFFGGYTISPVIVASSPEETLADLTDADAGVAFDLDGDGALDVGGWVRPSAGLLVWDPDREARIDSGRQLFGYVTWGLVFDHGYQALAALDEDGDGSLVGDELVGLRVWFDRDGDGRSNPAEVVDLATIGLVALRTDGAPGADGVWAHPAGARLSGGTTLPTFDWVAERRAIPGSRP